MPPKRKAQSSQPPIFFAVRCAGRGDPKCRGGASLDLNFDQGVGVVFLIAPLAVIRHLKT